MGRRHGCLASDVNIDVQNVSQQTLGIVAMNQLPLSYSHLSAEDSIEELHLTNRSFNALTRAGIRTVGELSRLVDSGRLRTISGLGRKSSSEIEGKVCEANDLDGAGGKPKIDSVPGQVYTNLSPEAPIKKLNLSRRSFNALRRVRIRTVEEVRKLVASGKLRTIRGLGIKSMLEITESLGHAKAQDLAEVNTPTFRTPVRNAASLSREDSIEKLDLSVRSYNALTRTGVQSIGEVLQLSDTGKLRTIRGLGKLSISEIKRKLAQMKSLEGVWIEADTDLSQNYIILSRKDLIEVLNLTAHSYSALARSGIRTIENLLQFVEFGDLQTVRELGIQCILEIANILPLMKIQDNPEVASWTPSDVWRWLVSKILRDSEVESIARRDEIPKRVVEWQLQFVSKQLSRGLLHEDAEIAGKSIREWITAIEMTESNSAYEVMSTILSDSINMCEEIEHFLSYLPGQNCMTILLFRHCPKPKTLEQTGVDLGITRERVRQLENDVKNKVRSINSLKSRPSLLRMQSALLIARDLGLDITYENWTQQIRSSGLVGDWTIQDYAGTDPVEAVIAVGNLLHTCKSWLQMPKNLQYAIELAASGTPNVRAKIPHARDTVPKKVRRLINRHAKFSGSVYDRWLSQEIGMGLEEVRDILHGLGYQVVAEGWFVPNSSRVSYHEVFHRCMRKMLQFCARLNIDDVCAGIRHGVSRSGFSEPTYLTSKEITQVRSMFPVPPPDVMVEILQIYRYQRQDEWYYWDGEIDEKLSAGETIIMNCLKVIGPVLHYSELALAFTESDLSIPTLNATLDGSPLFDKVNAGLYKLRGGEATLQNIERAKAAAGPQSLRPEIGYDARGNIIASLTLRTVALASGTIFCEQLPNLSGKWPCYVNGKEAGELIATENEFRHLRESFELLGCKPGNRLKFIFNMWNRTVEIELTGENAQV